MPPGRPPNPGGAGRSAPVLSIRLTAADEAALEVIRFDAAAAEGRPRRLSAAEAAQLAIRAEALRLAGAGRLDRATDVVLRRRTGDRRRRATPHG